jgi:ATP-binding cassette subfamily B (MDR/TAP) protein 1
LWIYFLVGGAVCGFANKFFFGWMSERIGLSVRSRLFKSTIDKDVTFFDTRSKGDLISRLSSDTNVIQEGLSNNVAMVV